MASKIPTTMRAIALAKYCKPAEYALATVPVPQITQPDDVLIKVHAASVNPVDVKLASGLASMMGLAGSFPYKIGYDVSGTIVETGSDVTNVKVGDQVYSRIPNSHRGTLAEYVSAPASFVALKPASSTHVEAASIPLAALTALQAIVYADSILEGGLKDKTVLVPGGLSGTGSFAVQILKRYFHVGKVITTLSPQKIPLAKGLLGEDALDVIVDYTKGSKATVKEIGKGTVDFMFDTVGQAVSLVEVVKNGGIIVSISSLPGGTEMKKIYPYMSWWVVSLLDVTSWFLQRYMGWYGVRYSFLSLLPNGNDLKTLAAQVDEGKLRPVVGRVAKLEDLEGVREGCQQVYDAKGGVGKFVVEVV